MARITVEDCLNHVDNRFELIHLAAKRVRHLRKGAEPLVVCKNKDIVLSLREIAAEKVIKVNAEEHDPQLPAGEPVPSLEQGASEPEEETVEEAKAEGESESGKE